MKLQAVVCSEWILGRQREMEESVFEETEDADTCRGSLILP